MIYLDNAATTKTDPRVVAAMLPYYTDWYGNPNSPHAAGELAKGAVELAREQVAALIHAKPDEIWFFHTATDANRYALEAGGGCVFSSRMEHSSIVDELDSLLVPEYIKPRPSGRIDPDEFKAFLDGCDKYFPGSTASFMLVNNETGVVNDVKSLAKIAGEYGLWFHTDATAAAGAMSIYVNELGCDMMTFSAHKMHGPKGIAALYCAEPELMNGRYFGTPDVPAIVGFGEACAIQQEYLRAGCGEDIDYRYLKHIFFTNLNEELNELTWQTNGRPGWAVTSAHFFDRIFSVRFDGVDAETLVMLCSQNGLMISAGAACNSEEKEPSHVLLAMGLSPEKAMESVRISFSRMTTADDCAEGAKILARCVNQLRGMSGGD